MTRERGVLVSGEQALALVAAWRVNALATRANAWAWVRDPTVVAPPAVCK
jgi:hypothetical protein